VKLVIADPGWPASLQETAAVASDAGLIDSEHHFINVLLRLPHSVSAVDEWVKCMGGPRYLPHKLVNPTTNEPLLTAVIYYDAVTFTVMKQQ